MTTTDDSKLPELRQARDTFLNSCDDTYEFPAGGKHPLLTIEEDALVASLGGLELSPHIVIEELQIGLDMDKSYSMVIFGVRTVIYGVRKNDVARFENGTLAILAGAANIDWRDLLAALAITENCASRLSCDFEDAVLEKTEWQKLHEKAKDTIRGYLTRSPEMREIDVMGIMAAEIDGELTFTNRS